MPLRHKKLRECAGGSEADHLWLFDWQRPCHCTICCGGVLHQLLGYLARSRPIQARLRQASNRGNLGRVDAAASDVRSSNTAAKDAVVDSVCNCAESADDTARDSAVCHIADRCRGRGPGSNAHDQHTAGCCHLASLRGAVSLS